MPEPKPNRAEPAYEFDAIVTGGGPGGSACAGFLAAGGARVILLERRKFPREKVCGDCLNPAAWPVLEALGVAGEVAGLPQTLLEGVELIDQHGRSAIVPWPASSRGEIAVKRSLLDHALLRRAGELGAEVREETMVNAVERVANGWEVTVSSELHSTAKLRAPWLIAADGRNSTVARLAGLLPSAQRDRLAVQTHFPAPPGFHDRVVLRLRPEGYCGYSRAGGGALNLCLVSTSAGMPALRAWAESQPEFAAGLTDAKWQSMAPLARDDAGPAHDGLLLAGDAARVVEPFTGEGIYYALRTGQLAAQTVLSSLKNGVSPEAAMSHYRLEHHRLYKGRLWINRLARLAVTSPRLGQLAFNLVRREPDLLRYLTAKVVSLK